MIAGCSAQLAARCIAQLYNCLHSWHTVFLTDSSTQSRVLETNMFS